MNNNNNMLKTLILGTLPILAYIIVDIIFKDNFLSLILALSIGFIEFAISLIIYKKVDFFIFIDLLLLTVLSLVSIFLKNEIFFKIKPAIIEILFIIYLIPLSLSKKYFQLYLSRYLKNNNFPQENINKIQKILIIIIPIILIHILLIILSAFLWSKEIWAFISSILLYILIVLFFVITYAINFFKKKLFLNKYKNEEWFNIVSEDGKVIGKAPRSICHNGSKLLHPVVHIHIINKKFEILLQKRSQNKDIQPGKWDTSIGGHIGLNESLENAIIRESKEELGIDINIKNIIPLSKYIFESEIEKEMVFSFIYFYNNEKLDYSKEEIEEVKFYPFKEINKLINSDLFTKNFKKEYEILKEYFTSK